MPQLIPCAEAHRGAGPVAELPKGTFAEEIREITYTNHLEQTLTVGDMLTSSYTDGFLVIYKGAIIHEEYRDMHDYQRHILQSVSKSLTACLLAVFIDQGAVDSTQSVPHYLPEFANTAYNDATVQNVLDMSAAVKYDETYDDMQSDVNLHSIAGGWYKPLEGEVAHQGIPGSLHEFLLTLQSKMDFAHGEVFHYVSANTDVLGLIIERVGNRPFTQLFQEHIWQHLGAEENAAMTVDAWGTAFPNGGFSVTLRDLARFGLMVLNDGWFNGRQIVPATFFADTRQNGSNAAWRRGTSYLDLMPNGAYHNQFWNTGNDHGAFFGVGIHGQYVYMDPTAEMVITKFSSLPVALDPDNSRNTLLGFQAIAKALVSR